MQKKAIQAEDSRMRGVEGSAMTDETLLTPLNNKSVVDRIIERITNSIVSGELRPGSKLPTEIELSESLGVGRNSVREAVKALVAMGVLTIKRSEGTFVAEGFSPRMMEPMIYGLILEGGSTPAVLELRYVVDTGNVQLAIDKATAEDIDRLGGALAKLRQTIDTGMPVNVIHEADVNFHTQLEHIARNPLLEKVSMVVNRLTDFSRRSALEEILRNGDQEYFYELHKAIYDVVRNQERENVSSVMELHFGYWKKEFKKKEE